MKVGIIGFGFVGNALFKGMKKSVDIIKIDPKLGTDINDLISFEPDFVFISVPTPMNDDGAQDLSILNSVFDQIKDSQLNTTLILKSTVTPENLHLEKLEFIQPFKRKIGTFINGEITHLEEIKNFAERYLFLQRIHFVQKRHFN